MALFHTIGYILNRPQRTQGIAFETVDGSTFFMDIFNSSILEQQSMHKIITGFVFDGCFKGLMDHVFIVRVHRVQKSLICRTELVGIQLEYAWYCKISNCVFDECDTYGIYTAAAGSGTAYSDIRDSAFYNCGTSAMALLGGADNNRIYRNSIYNANAQGAGVATNEGIIFSHVSRSLPCGRCHSGLRDDGERANQLLRRHDGGEYP